MENLQDLLPSKRFAPHHGALAEERSGLLTLSVVMSGTPTRQLSDSNWGGRLVEVVPSGVPFGLASNTTWRSAPRFGMELRI